MAIISSRDNELIKEYISLTGSAVRRRATRRFTLEGARLLSDALRSGIKIENAFFTAQALRRYNDLAGEIIVSSARLFEVNEQVALKLADTQSAQGIFCTAFMLDKKIELSKINIYGTYLAIENLQDPGNLGTMLRTAEAMGLDGAILSSNCADIWSPKVVRAAMGAIFRLPFIITEDLPNLFLSLREKNMRVIAAVVNSGANSILNINLSCGVVVVVGNEGSGLSEECINACTELVTIPMRGRAESLNAAAAASILMWELIRQKS